MRFNPKYIQLIGDAFIPILGFFYWSWNLYFLLLFYFLDLITKEVLLHVKSNKIVQFKQDLDVDQKRKEKYEWLKFGSSSLILLFFVMFLSQMSMPFIQNDFNSLKELNSFWFYKDMGVEQGYILLPLIVFMGYTQYKIEFLKPVVYSKLSVNELWKPHMQSILTMMAFTALIFSIAHFILIPEWIIVISIVLLSSLYQLLTINKR